MPSQAALFCSFADSIFYSDLSTFISSRMTPHSSIGSKSMRRPLLGSCFWEFSETSSSSECSIVDMEIRSNSRPPFPTRSCSIVQLCSLVHFTSSPECFQLLLRAFLDWSTCHLAIKSQCSAWKCLLLRQPY